jgi:putative endonuclease
MRAAHGMSAIPNIVYVIRSDAHPDRYYTGVTSDLGRRLAAHNRGDSRHTASSRPWCVVVSVEFRDPKAAAAFEKYLKSGSGRTFAARHFRDTRFRPGWSTATQE